MSKKCMSNEREQADTGYVPFANETLARGAAGRTGSSSRGRTPLHALSDVSSRGMKTTTTRTTTTATAREGGGIDDDGGVTSPRDGDDVETMN